MIRTTYTRRVGCYALASIAVAACTAANQAPPTVCGATQGTSSAAAGLASADTSFSVAFFEPALTAAGAGQNVIVSPYSATATLTMVDVGAAGETATQMQTALHLPGTGSKVAPAYAALACDDETNGSSEGNQLSVANSIWGQEGKAFESSFLSVLRSGYGAPLQQVDFNGDASGAMTAINQWVSDETHSKIPSLLQPGDIDRTTKLVLVNAVYFNGVWDVGFDPNDTAPRPFTLSDGTMVSVPTMSAMVNLAMTTGGAVHPDVVVYELPYKGGAMVMDFLLPSGSLSALEESLTASMLNAALASVGPAESQVTLDLPKFSFTTRLALKPLLSGMGMTDVFDPNKADLSGMDGEKDLYLSAVVQEALVEVDEQGTVAAAATAGVTDTAGSESEAVTIDHPFLFLIRNKKSGSILFTGRVEDPRR